MAKTAARLPTCSDVESADQDLQSVRFFGIHKFLPPRRQNGQVSANLHECFVLLPDEGLVNIPFDAGADPAGSARQQLELQTGYTADSCQLLLSDGEVTSEALAGGGGGLTLQLQPRPQFRQLLASVAAGSAGCVKKWLLQLRSASRLRPSASFARSPAADCDEQQQQQQHQRQLLLVAHAAFVLACCRNNCDIVRLFVQLLPVVANMRTHGTQRCGLHFACYHELPDVIRLLLAKTAPATAQLRDCAGLRPVDYAGHGSRARSLVLNEWHGRPLTTSCHGDGQQLNAGLRLFSFPLPGQAAVPAERRGK